MKIKSKLLTPHRKDCSAVKAVKRGNWGTPWAFLETIEKRDAIGRSKEHGYRRWWRVRCNDVDCPGVITIDEKSILEAL
jgi:hypothetical protein